jgi:hypothetical protein
VLLRGTMKILRQLSQHRLSVDRLQFCNFAQHPAHERNGPFPSGEFPPPNTLAFVLGWLP